MRKPQVAITDPEQALRDRNVRLICKSDSLLMRVLDVLLFATLYLAVFFPVLLAVFRAWFECESYAVSYLAHRHYGSRYTRTQYREWMADAVGGAIYAWSLPKVVVERLFDFHVDRIGART
jgi:hypothetical protein